MALEDCVMCYNDFVIVQAYTLDFFGLIFSLTKLLGYRTLGDMKCPLTLGKSGSVWDWD